MEMNLKNVQVPIQTLRVNDSRIRRIKNAKFQGIVFIWTRTYSEIFKSVLVYL